MTRKVIVKTALYLAAVLFLILFGFPFVFTLLSSFKTKMDYMTNLWGLPKTIYFGNFATIVQKGFFTYLTNSIIVTMISLALTLIFSSMAGYAFAKLRFRISSILFTLFLAGMMIPVHTTLIPIYQLTKRLGMYNQVWALIGPYVSFTLPLSIFVITNFFKTIPEELREAALVDGCSHFRIYYQIMLPLSIPALATVGIVDFLHTWNEFMYSFILIDDPKKMTLPLGVRFFASSETADLPATLTCLLCASLPVMIFYFIAQENVINGLAAGAVKG